MITTKAGLNKAFEHTDFPGFADFDYVREFSDALMADKHFGSRTREHVIKLVFYRRRREAYDLASLAPTPVDREDMAEQAARLQV